MDQNFHAKQEAEELLVLPDAVQIFFVDASGTCSTFSNRSTLRVFKLAGAGEAAEITAFIQVGEWTYPLVQGASPVLEAANGAFMFPDAFAQENEGTAVGLVFAEGVSPEAREQFRDVIGQLIKLKVEEQLPEAQQLGALGKSLVTAAESINQGMAYAAERAASYIEAKSEQTRRDSAAAQQDAKVSPYVKTTVKGAGYATKATAAATGLVADAVGQLTRHTADYLARKIDKPNSTTPAGKTRTTLIDAARGGLIAYGTVYAGLEQNAKTLGGCIQKNTVQVVQHKHGKEAGELSGDAMGAVGDGVRTYFNIASLGIKGIAKSTAKYTVQGVLIKENSAHGLPSAQGSIPVVVPVPQGSVTSQGSAGALPVVVAQAAPAAQPPPAPSQRPPPPSYDSAVKHPSSTEGFV